VWDVELIPNTYYLPRDEALRNSATPTVGSGGRMQIGDGKSEIQNLPGWARAFLIPNSDSASCILQVIWRQP